MSCLYFYAFPFQNSKAAAFDGIFCIIFAMQLTEPYWVPKAHDSPCEIWDCTSELGVFTWVNFNEAAEKHKHETSIWQEYVSPFKDFNFVFV